METNQFAIEQWKVEKEQQANIKELERKWSVFALATFGGILYLVFSSPLLVTLPTARRATLIVWTVASLHIFAAIWMKHSLYFRLSYYRSQARLLAAEMDLGRSLPRAWRVPPYRGDPPHLRRPHESPEGTQAADDQVDYTKIAARGLLVLWSWGYISRREYFACRRDPKPAYGDRAASNRWRGWQDVFRAEYWRSQATAPREGKALETLTIVFLLAISTFAVNARLDRDFAPPEALRAAGISTQISSDSADSLLDRLLFGNSGRGAGILASLWPIAYFKWRDRRNLSKCWGLHILPLIERDELNPAHPPQLPTPSAHGPNRYDLSPCPTS